MSIKSLIGSIPTIRAPEKNPSSDERIKWTLVAGFIFMVMGFTPLPVAPDSFPSAYRQYFPYNDIFTILAVGIGPIITGTLLMQIILRFRLLGLDFNNVVDRRFFYGLQKIVILVLAVLGAYTIIEGFGLADDLNSYLGLAFVMVIGTISLIYLDDLVVKWGLGSGLGLFVAITTFKLLLYGMYDSLSRFSDYLITYNRFEYSLIIPTIFTLGLGILTYLLLKKVKSFNVTTNMVSGKYNLVYFFAAAFVSIGAVELFTRNTGFLNDSLSGLLLPDNWYMLLEPATLVKVVIYLILDVILSLILSFMTMWLCGFNKLHIQPPSFKLSEAGKEEELQVGINKIVPISVALIILFSYLGMLLGAISFLTIVITVGYLNRCVEEINGTRKVCPNCGSAGIEWLLPGSWCMWECRNCGYRGALVIDLDNTQKQ